MSKDEMKETCWLCGCRSIQQQSVSSNGSDVGKVIGFIGGNGANGQLGERGNIHDRRIVWAPVGCCVRCDSPGVDVWTWHWFTATRPAHEWNHLHDRPSMCCRRDTDKDDYCG